MKPPDGMGAYRFAVLAGLRATQLIGGCTARVDVGTHKPITVAQLEIVAGMTTERLEETDTDEAPTVLDGAEPDALDPA